MTPSLGRTAHGGRLMLIDKGKTIADLQEHMKRYEWNTGKRTEFDDGYLTGLRFAIKLIELQEAGVLGQVAFDWKD